MMAGKPRDVSEAAPGIPIGVIGLGLVGSAISANLLELGHRVLGLDISEEKVAHFVDSGGEAAARVSELGERCSIIFVCVFSSAQSADALTGHGGLVSGKFRTKAVFDTTTADPKDSIRIAERLADNGITYFDAPLSGSSNQIRHGEGVFLVGGNEASYKRYHPFLATLSHSQFYLGGSGSGSKAKIASNLVLGLNRLALAEGLVFADLLGLNLPGFLALLRETPAYSRAIDVKGEKMLAGDFTAQSKISQHRKDLDIILDYAGQLAQPLPLAEVHHEILLAAESGGLGDSDTSAVIEQLRRMGGRKATSDPE